MTKPLYSFPGRTMVEMLRLEARNELDPEEGNPFNLIKGSGQSAVSALQMGVGVVVEIVTEYDAKFGHPTKWVAVVLKPGEAMRLAQEMQEQAFRAVEHVAFHEDEALQDWQSIQDSIEYARKKAK